MFYSKMQFCFFIPAFLIIQEIIFTQEHSQAYLPYDGWYNKVHSLMQFFSSLQYNNNLKAPKVGEY